MGYRKTPLFILILYRDYIGFISVLIARFRRIKTMGKHRCLVGGFFNEPDYLLTTVSGLSEKRADAEGERKV